MLTDTHCHLAEPSLLHDLPAVLAQAAAVNVCRFIVPSTCRTDFNAVLSLHRVPDIQVALGIHPWFAGEAVEADFDELERLLIKHSQALVGEIGLDFHDKNLLKSSREQQTECLLQQLQLAEKLKRPVIIHNLKSSAALMTAVRKTGFQQGGIVHAFSGSLEEAHTFINHGLLIGVGSLLLNPNARKVRQAATMLPAEHLVFETDSPFMLPKDEGVNSPANVRRIAEIAADLRGVCLADLAEQTEANVSRLLAFQLA